jgi:hypothetical protein
VTASFCLINHAIDGTYWFYAPSVAYALGAVQKSNQWKIPVAKWISGALWLVLPAATLFVSLMASLFRRKEFFTRRDVVSVLFVAQFLLAAGALLMEEFRGQPLLQLSYYASYLIPFMFLAVGSQFLRIPPLTKLRFSAIVIFTLALLSLPWGISDGFWAKLHGPIWPFGVVVLAICACGVLFGRLPGLVAVLASCGIFYSYLLAGQGAKAGNAARGSFVRIAHDVQEIEKVRQGRPIRFWYDAAEPFGLEFFSLNSTYLWGYTFISYAFPAAPKDVVWPPNTLLVVPSSRGDTVDEAVKSHKFDGEILTLESQVLVDAEGGRYSLTFYGARSDPEKVH